MDNRAGEMAVFARTVEAGSFSEAARQLQMAPSTIAKLIGRIEQRIGVRLFERSTRRLVLTDEGRHYYQRSLQILGDIDELENGVATGAAEISGAVRVNAAVAFGTIGVEPLLPELLRHHPRLTVDLSLSDEVVDLYLERADIAFRVGELTPSNLVAIKLGTTPRIIVGSPDYLADAGTPTTIADLEKHNCLGFNFRRTVSIWPVVADANASDRPISGNFTANNGETVRRLAIRGAGLARLGQFHVAEDLAAGRLVQVLNGIIDEDEDFFAVHTGGQHMAPRIRAFLDFIVPPLRKSLAGK